MATTSVTVIYAPLASCLVNVPSKVALALSLHGSPTQRPLIKLGWKDPATSKEYTLYTGWSGGTARSLGPSTSTSFGKRSTQAVGDAVELDPSFAFSANLAEGQKVDMTFIHDAPHIESATLDPLTSDDWELMELHAGIVEEQVLNQIRGVSLDQQVVVWVPSAKIHLRVVSIEPGLTFGTFGLESEVYISPKVRKSKGEEEPRRVETTQEEDQAPTSLLCRLLPMSHVKEVMGVKGDGSMDAYSVYLHPEAEQCGFARTDGWALLSTVVPVDGARGAEKQRSASSARYPSRIPVTMVIDTSVPLGHTVVGRGLRLSFSSAPFECVVLSRFERGMEETIDVPRTVSLAVVGRSYGTSPPPTHKAIIEAFKVWVKGRTGRRAGVKEVRLARGQMIDLEIGEKGASACVSVQMGRGEGERTKAEASGVYRLTPSTVDGVQFSVIDQGIDAAPPHWGVEEKGRDVDLPRLGGVDELQEKVKGLVGRLLKTTPLSGAFGIPVGGSALILGRQGSGKSSLIQRICHDLSVDSTLLSAVVTVNAQELSEDRLSVVTEKLSAAFVQAAWKSPSIIVIDDMERLFPAEVEHADSTRSRQLVERFISLTSRWMGAGREYPIVLLGSAVQAESLHPLLGQTHFFTETLHLPAPGRAERALILEAILEDAKGRGTLGTGGVGEVDLGEVARTAEGYMPSDLRMLVQRSVQEWGIRQAEAEMSGETSSKSMSFSQQDIVAALTDYVPVSLKGIPLQGSTVKWSDIGGLESVKQILLETLEWPTKYAAIFANCPLRLRSGLLLYGYPGCGKTLLASAVAKECGLNFVSVKGPELLNKYIGASEKSVRDLFERAQAARPCVLFFDEFDSIAPRRGHDSTGVTDRVVNQLLTQMDGAEGLEGVYVLAATSRPDLIDPALLRPGRLDKALFCNVPRDEEEIGKIFTALASQVDVEEGIPWEEVARRCIGYTGADLQALLYNAHLLAIHDMMEGDEKEGDEERGKKEGSNEYGVKAFSIVRMDGEGARHRPREVEMSALREKLRRVVEGHRGDGVEAGASKAKGKTHSTKVTLSLLERALETSKPSLPTDERTRLDRIYTEFMEGRDANMPSGMGPTGVGQRVTLS